MKDPAALLYIDKYISSTNGMKSITRGWYIDLILHLYDKGPIPNDEDEIAGICRVRPSEYHEFKQVVKHLLKQKFKQNENGCWENSFASEVIQKRKSFKDKRSKSGNIGVIIKLAKTIKGFNDKLLDRLKKDLYDKDQNEIEKHKDKQVLKQMLKLYINVDEDEDINKEVITLPFKTEKFKKAWKYWKDYKKEEFKFNYKSSKSESTALMELKNLSKDNENTAIEIIKKSVSNGWRGFFELKNNSTAKKEKTIQENKEIKDPENYKNLEA